VPLIQLIYVSQPAGPVGSHELIQIVDSCRRNNEKSGVTGMLAFSGEHFLQLLEGPEEEVSRTFERIERDTRHRQIRLIARHPVAQRAFGDWSMGFAGMGAFNADLLRQCLGTGTLDPAALQPGPALDFLAALAQRTGATSRALTA